MRFIEFETKDEESDEDFIVVLKNMKGCTHLNEGKKEYFIFGINDWKKKMEFSDDYANYYEIFNDEIMAFPNNVVYMNDSFKEIVKSYQETFTSKLSTWLKKVYSYFIFYYELGDLNKNMYHLIRISYIVKNYETACSFSLYLDEETETFIRKFKRSENREAYRNIIRETLGFIKKEASKNE